MHCLNGQKNFNLGYFTKAINFGMDLSVMFAPRLEVDSLSVPLGAPCGGHMAHFFRPSMDIDGPAAYLKCGVM